MRLIFESRSKDRGDRRWWVHDDERLIGEVEVVGRDKPKQVHVRPVMQAYGDASDKDSYSPMWVGRGRWFVDIQAGLVWLKDFWRKS